MRFVINPDKKVVATAPIEPKGLIDALNAEMEKWKMIVDWYEEGGECVDDGGVQTCALCTLFYLDVCVGCPLSMAGECCASVRSTYQAYTGAVEAGDTKAAKEAAKRMLRLLIQLLDEQSAKTQPA